MFNSFTATRPIFVVANFIKLAVFKTGMLLVRASCWGVGLSSNEGWYISRPPKAGSGGQALSGYAKHKEQLKSLLWMVAEPCGDDTNTGVIPQGQMDLIREVCKGVWCGGAENAFMSLLEQVAEEEGLKIGY
jgi:hypothetical protein